MSKLPLIRNFLNETLDWWKFFQLFLYFSTDINECRIGGPQGHNCPDNSRCINTEGSFECSCFMGYSEVVDNLGSFTCEGKAEGGREGGREGGGREGGRELGGREGGNG